MQHSAFTKISKLIFLAKLRTLRYIVKFSMFELSRTKQKCFMLLKVIYCIFFFFFLYLIFYNKNCAHAIIILRYFAVKLVVYIIKKTSKFFD